MNDQGPFQLDRLLHQPVRTRIVAYLATRGQVTFTELKKALETTDGNLEAHIKKLANARYIEIFKNENEGRTQTLYELTTLGSEQFEQYVRQLQDLLNLGKH